MLSFAVAQRLLRRRLGSMPPYRTSAALPCLAALFAAVAAAQPAHVERARGVGLDSAQGALLDTDGDGFPDAAELLDERDRAAFRGWMAAIAVAQKRAPDPRWRLAERDCAGLVRFAYREALRRHGDGYAMRGLSDPPPFDVARFAYPAVPLLGQALFLVPGAEQLPPGARRVGGRAFSPFAEGRVLVEGSARRVPIAPQEALAADLLYFAPRPSARFDRHLMLVAGALPDGDRLLVYHTGPDDSGSGEVRLVALKALLRHPDPDWHPAPDNPLFLGVYRWKILD